MKARILRDWTVPGTAKTGSEIQPGTVVEVTCIGSICYSHPETGEEWITYDGDFEIVED